VTNTAEDRRAQLEAELAQLEAQEKAQAEEQRRQELAKKEAELPPEMRAQKQNLEAKANEVLEREFPPAWLPQKNKDDPELIVGLVLRIDPRVGPSKTWGTYSAVVEVRATDGREWTLWCNEGGALHNQLTRQRIQPGEVIAAKYRGKKDSLANPGQSYHDFRLARLEDDSQPAAPVDYDALARAQGGGEQPALPAATPAPASAPPPDDDIPF
jgi:hypothetical protein